MVVVHDKLFSGTRWTDPVTTGVLEVTSPATNTVVGRVAETTTDDPPVMIQPCVTAAAGPCTIEQKDS